MKETTLNEKFLQVFRASHSQKLKQTIVPYLVSCRFLFWFSLRTFRKTSLVRLPSPPLPSGGKSGDGGSSGDRLPLEAPTESRDAPVSLRPVDSLPLSTVR